jgi:hypothetical protein
MSKKLGIACVVGGLCAVSIAQTNAKNSVKTPTQESVLVAAPQGVGNPDCTTLANPVYFPATTLIESLLSKVAPTLADGDIMGDDQMTVIHVPLSSCITYEVHKDQVPLTGTAVYYAADGTQLACEMPVGNDAVVSDLSAMDVGGVTCLGGETPPRTSPSTQVTWRRLAL